MRIFFVFILLSGLFASCTSVKITHKNELPYRTSYSIIAPRYDSSFSREGGAYHTRFYIYPDSVTLYTSDESYPPNSENIRSLGDSLYKLRFYDVGFGLNRETKNQEISRFRTLPDTLDLSGMDGNSLYWREIIIDFVSVGYMNVPEAQKEIFDKALNSLKVTK